MRLRTRPPLLTYLLSYLLPPSGFFCFASVSTWPLIPCIFGARPLVVCFWVSPCASSLYVFLLSVSPPFCLSSGVLSLCFCCAPACCLLTLVVACCRPPLLPYFVSLLCCGMLPGCAAPLGVGPPWWLAVLY